MAEVKLEHYQCERCNVLCQQEWVPVCSKCGMPMVKVSVSQAQGATLQRIDDNTVVVDGRTYSAVPGAVATGNEGVELGQAKAQLDAMFVQLQEVTAANDVLVTDNELLTAALATEKQVSEARGGDIGKAREELEAVRGDLASANAQIEELTKPGKPKK